MCERQTLLSVDVSGCLYLCGELECSRGVLVQLEKNLFFSQCYSCQKDIDWLEGWRFILAGLDLEPIQQQFTVYLDCLFVCYFSLDAGRLSLLFPLVFFITWTGLVQIH